MSYFYIKSLFKRISLFAGWNVGGMWAVVADALIYYDKLIIN